MSPCLRIVWIVLRIVYSISHHMRVSSTASCSTSCPSSRLTPRLACRFLGSCRRLVSSRLVSSRYRRPVVRPALLAALSIRRPSPRLLLAFFRLLFVWRITVSSVPSLSPPCLPTGGALNCAGGCDGSSCRGHMMFFLIVSIFCY